MHSGKREYVKKNKKQTNKQKTDKKAEGRVGEEGPEVLDLILLLEVNGGTGACASAHTQKQK